MTPAATVEDTVSPDVESTITREMEPFRQEVALLEARAATLTVTDDLSEAVAVEFIVGAKQFYDEMEEKRDQRVRPLNTEVKAINAAYRPYSKVLDRLWRATDQIRSTYVTKKQLAIEAANRTAIAEAAERRRVEEAKAEAARQEAQRLRDEVDRLERAENDRLLQAEMDRLAAEQQRKDDEAAVVDATRRGDAAAVAATQTLIDDAKREEEERAKKAEEDRLRSLAAQVLREKQAIKLDAKADIAESKATMVAPTIHVNESVGTRVLAGGGTSGTRKVVDWHFTNGLPKEGDYFQDDPRVAGIPARYFKLDLSMLGKDVKNRVPVDGTMRTEGSATTAGRK